MKKMMLGLLLLAFITPVMASELTLKASYEAVGLSVNDFDEVRSSTGTDQGDSDNLNFFYQRFRVQPMFEASKGIKGILRFDFAEGIWGQDQGFASVRAGDTTTNGDSAELQVDRAYVDITQEMYRLRVGLQFVNVGQMQVFRDNQPAIQLNINTPTPFGLRLGYIKVSESIGTGATSALSEDGSTNEDTDRFLIDLSYKSDSLKVNAFYVMQKDDSTDGVSNYKDEPSVAGIYARGNLGDIYVKGELAVFGGDNGNGTDYTGTQLNLNGSKKFGDAFTLMADAWYSSAADSDETKITLMGNPFATKDIFAGGSMGWDDLITARLPAIAIVCKGGPLGGGDVFDPYKTGAGSIGGGLGAMYTGFGSWTFMGIAQYMTAADNDLGIVGEFDNATNLVLYAGYQLTAHTSLHGVYERVEASFMDDRDPGPASIYTIRMRVMF